MVTLKCVFKQIVWFIWVVYLFSLISLLISVIQDSFPLRNEHLIENIFNSRNSQKLLL